MRSREDILALLNEPLNTLNPDEIKDIEKMAATDSDIAVLLTQSRALGNLSEATVFGEAAGSDAEFLAKLRQRMDSTEAQIAKRPVFITARRLALASAICVMLLVVVMEMGARKIAVSVTSSVTTVQNLADALTMPSSLPLDSLSDEISSVDSLASYLGISDLADAWAEDSDMVPPVTDQLLTMDTKDLEDILHELEQTNFF